MFAMFTATSATQFLRYSFLSRSLYLLYLYFIYLSSSASSVVVGWRWNLVSRARYSITGRDHFFLVIFVLWCMRDPHRFRVRILINFGAFLGGATEYPYARILFLYLYYLSIGDNWKQLLKEFFLIHFKVTIKDFNLILWISWALFSQTLLQIYQKICYSSSESNDHWRRYKAPSRNEQGCVSDSSIIWQILAIEKTIYACNVFGYSLFCCVLIQNKMAFK